MSAVGLLVDLIGCAVAQAILPRISFGLVYLEPFSASPAPLRWPGCRRDATGRIELRQRVGGWIGFAICLLALVAIAAAIGALVRGGGG